jgi:hypothetical protein
MKLTGGLVAVAAVLALTACDKNENKTGAAVDQTSGSTGMSADATNGSASNTTTTTNAAPTSGQTTTDVGTTQPTTDTSKTATGKKSDAVPTKEAKAGTNSSGAYLPPAEQPTSTDTSATDTSISSGTSSADANVADSKLAADAKNDAMSKAYEPQSKSPDKTGSTSLTGQDRSHAQSMQRKGTFVDPTVEPNRDATAANQSVQNLNLAQYPYNKRSQFKAAMDDRLGLIEERLQVIRSDASNKDLASSIESKHEAAEKKLNEADKVDQNRWEGYKIEFRDQIADLERSVNSVSSVRR